MRKIVLALIALACTVPAAEAARRDERGPAVSRTAPQSKPPVQTRAVQTQRPAAAPRATRQATRQPAARQGTARRDTRGATMRQAALRPGDVRTSRSGVLLRSASAATVSRDAMSRRSVAGWQSGLMPVDYAQRECPEGTFATLARGHENVVRCMPL